MNELKNIQQTVDQIIAERGTAAHSVIPILQSIQTTYNYLPEEALKYVCEKTEITPEQIVGVASFYSQFRMHPVGKHIIKVCVGTACHVKGAGQVYDAFRRHFNLTGREDTDDSRTYTIEKVSCLGCCTLAPVVQIDEITYGHVASDKVGNVLADFEKHAGISGAKKGLFRNADGSEIQGEIRIGLGSCCVASGSQEVKKAVEETVADTGIKISLKNVGCVGMQSFWKHRGNLFVRRNPNLGWVVLPNMLIFQLILPLLSPLVDITLVFSLFMPKGGIIVLLYFGYYFLDLCISILAFRFDSEKFTLRDAGNLFLQRIIYRQLLWYVLMKGYLRAMKGELAAWGFLKRTGSVEVAH